MNPSDTIRDQLTREAQALRPAFSQPLHERVMSAVRGARRESAPPRAAWPRYAAAAVVALCAALAMVVVFRPPAAPVVTARPMLPIITIRITAPQMPDLDREARRALRRAAFAAEQLLEAGPLPIVINDPGP